MAHARPHLESDASQGIIYYSYDALDRLVEERHPDGTKIAFAHANAVSLAEEFKQWVTPEPPAGDDDYSYWIHSNAVSVSRLTDARGNHSVLLQNRFGQTVAILDALGQRTSYLHGAFNTLEGVTDPARRQISFEHDAYNGQIAVIDAAHGGKKSSEYNAFGEIVRSTDPTRDSLFTYDVLGRVTHVADADGTSVFVYDGSGPNEKGRLVEATSAFGQSTIYTYEAPTSLRNRGLVTKVKRRLMPPGATSATPREFTTSYAYDDYSRIERIEYPGEASQPFSVQYSFDSFGHTLSARDAADPARMFWELLEADQGYRIRKERSGNGTVTERTYEPLTGLLSSVVSLHNGTRILDRAYSYDRAGNLETRIDRVSSATESYEYDALNRPTLRRNPNAPPTTAFRYDPLKGRLEFQLGVGEYTYESDGRDWTKTAGGTTYTHDAIGNIRTRSGTAVPGGLQVYDYTAANLPSVVQVGDGPRASTVSFAYDARGARTVKQFASGFGDVVTTYYAGESYQAIERGDATDDMAHRYVVMVGSRAVAQVTKSAGDEVLRYLHDDVLGSVSAITRSDGLLAGGREYGPFGATPDGFVLGSDVPLGFTGHEHDVELGLINMRGRMYDPIAGQFLSPDPIVAAPFAQGLNRFAYVNNSPLNRTDPSGFTSEEVTLGINIGMGVGFGTGLALTLANLTPSITATVTGGLTAGSVGASAASGTAIAGSLGAGAPGAGGHAAAAIGSLIRLGFGPTNVPYLGSATVPATRSAVAARAGAPSRGQVNADAISPVQERADSIARRPPGRRRPRGGVIRPGGSGGTVLRGPVRPVRISRAPIERLPGGDAVTQNGNVWLTPRGQRPPPRDPVGDRLAEIAVEVARDFNYTWLTDAQVRELTMLNMFRPWRFDSVYRRYAGQAIETEIGVRARHDPITSQVESVSRQRPGPDFRQAPGSNVYYEVTTVRQLSEHLRREGLRPDGGRTRLILYILP